MTKRKLKTKIKILLIGIIVLIIVLISAFFTYIYLESPVDKNQDTYVQLTVNKGASTKEIAKLLKENTLIKSELLFELLARFNKNTLKAATYQLQRSMSSKQILDILTDGNIYDPDIIRITFLEGNNITQYAQTIAAKTDHTYDEVIKVMNDKEYLKTLISKYWFLTDEILNPNIYYPLEGYLSPNTYEFQNKQVAIEKIIETMLSQTDVELEPYKDKITGENTVHKFLTMASVVELEGIKPEDRKMIVGVFNNRINLGMNMGSDVTTYYALQKSMTADLTVDEFQTKNLYNTRAANMGGKLPIGPICNPSTSSIEASFQPEDNDYLFFVADKNGKVYYNKTEQEHFQTISEIKEAGDWIW